MMKKTYKAILGKKNRIFYQVKFEQFDKEKLGLTASLNWSAFFAGGIWALYRKMYGWFFVLLGCVFASIMLRKAQLPVWSAFAIIVPWIIFSFSANALYQKSLKKKIAKARITVKDKKDLIEYLKHIGGVHSWVVWVFGAGIPSLILLAILIPILADR